MLMPSYFVAFYSYAIFLVNLGETLLSFSISMVNICAERKVDWRKTFWLTEQFKRLSRNLLLLLVSFHVFFCRYGDSMSSSVGTVGGLRNVKVVVVLFVPLVARILRYVPIEEDYYLKNIYNGHYKIALLNDCTTGGPIRFL